MGAGLDTGSAWDDEHTIVFFGLGEIGFHEVGVAESRITLDDKEIDGLLIAWAWWCPGSDDVDFFHSEVCAWLGLESALFELCVWVFLDDAVADGFVDEGTESAVVGLDGVSFEWLPGVGADL